MVRSGRQQSERVRGIEVKKTEVPHRLVVILLIILAVFLFGQLIGLFFEATSAYNWFREIVHGS
jgi:hypothetical protein